MSWYRLVLIVDILSELLNNLPVCLCCTDTSMYVEKYLLKLLLTDPIFIGMIAALLYVCVCAAHACVCCMCVVCVCACVCCVHQFIMICKFHTHARLCLSSPLHGCCFICTSSVMKGHRTTYVLCNDLVPVHSLHPHHKV